MCIDIVALWNYVLKARLEPKKLVKRYLHLFTQKVFQKFFDAIEPFGKEPIGCIKNL